ncbi:hypothetical protein [Heyndrickxia camelliae]|uniref:hypothetical protein n=1 Tax=Heyndrickxia camelliae TaxID=1707093 RepID=UPI0013FD4142|nr:hypothetical protein [Heyndrickxia camelliae]
MTIEEMVKELKEPMRSFVKEFIKDCYEHRNDDVYENVIELLTMIKNRYIKNSHI